MAQHLTKVDPRAEEMLVTARAVLAVALHPKHSLEIPVIAHIAGLTEDAVRDVLNSPIYQELMTEQVRMLVSGVMLRGVRALDQIICSEDSTDANKISATKAGIQLLAVVTANKPRDQSDEAESKLAVALRLIEQIGTKNREAS